MKCGSSNLRRLKQGRFPNQEVSEKRQHTIVLHHVQTSLGEDGDAHGDQVHLPRRNAILGDHVARRVAGDGSDQVGGTGVQMRRQHATRSQLQERDAGAHSGKSGEGCDIGVDDGAVGAVVVWVGVEVEVPVRLLGEKGVAIEVCCCGAEGGIEGGVDGAGFGRSDEGGEEGDEEEGLGEHCDSGVVVVV
jgi:hypothetical protein